MALSGLNEWLDRYGEDSYDFQTILAAFLDSGPKALLQEPLWALPGVPHHLSVSLRFKGQGAVLAFSALSHS